MSGGQDGMDMIEHNDVGMYPQSLVFLTKLERSHDTIKERGRGEHMLSTNKSVGAEVERILLVKSERLHVITQMAPRESATLATTASDSATVGQQSEQFALFVPYGRQTT
jgi:hypothetical protein